MKMSRRPHIKQALVLTVCDDVLILANTSFVKGKEILQGKAQCWCWISSFRVSWAYPVAAYRGCSVHQKTGAWEGPSGHPHRALQGLGLSSAGWTVLFGVDTQKIVCLWGNGTARGKPSAKGSNCYREVSQEDLSVGKSSWSVSMCIRGALLPCAMHAAKSFELILSLLFTQRRWPPHFADEGPGHNRVKKLTVTEPRLAPHSAHS